VIGNFNLAFSASPTIGCCVLLLAGQPKEIDYLVESVQ
jgi:hypothetical protein